MRGLRLSLSLARQKGTYVGGTPAVNALVDGTNNLVDGLNQLIDG